MRVAHRCCLAFCHAAGPAIILASKALFCANLASSCGWALAAVATLEAIQNVGRLIGGALAPILTGGVVQATGSFTPALVLGCRDRRERGAYLRNRGP